MINNEVADFPQLYSFCNVLPNSIVNLAPELEGLSMKKQHLLLQQSHRRRQQMCPKSKTSDKVCKIGKFEHHKTKDRILDIKNQRFGKSLICFINLISVTVNLNALASSKLRVLLPVLPSGDDAEKESNENNKVSKSMSAVTDLSSTVEQSIDGRNKISMNDSVYGYKAIVLKKITEEGLKDLLENGSKSKVTATVTYKVMYTLRPLSNKKRLN